MRDDGGFVWEATMSEQKDDGGHAFPTAKQWNQMGCVADAYPGMSLRDWFAGMALQGVLGADFDFFSEEKFSYAAENAYGFADAMIAARRK